MIKRKLQTMMLVVAVTSLLFEGGVYGAAEVHGSIYTNAGPDIYDTQLRQLLDHYIPAANVHSTLLILTECYGGDKMDDLATRPNTTTLSATSVCQVAYYGGYHDDAAKALKPGVGRTSDDVHNAGIAGKHASESPQKQGPVASLTKTHPDSTIKSRHVLVFAGHPNAQDNADVNNIKNNFTDQQATTVTAVGANGAAPYDYPGTLQGLKDALNAIKPQMNPSEQFILFVTDHGDKHVVDPAPLNFGDSSQSEPLSFPAPTQQDMQNDPNNKPQISLFSPGDIQPGPVTVYTTNVTFSNVTFDWPIDLNDDGDLFDEDEGWLALVEIDESQINWEGEIIAVSSLEPELNLSEIDLESGGIAKIPPEYGQIPTLTEWGMIVFCILLFGWMALVIVRRKRWVTSEM
jgi:hypothetical protein